MTPFEKHFNFGNTAVDFKFKTYEYGGWDADTMKPVYEISVNDKFVCYYTYYGDGSDKSFERIAKSLISNF